MKLRIMVLSLVMLAVITIAAACGDEHPEGRLELEQFLNRDTLREGRIEGLAVQIGAGKSELERSFGGAPAESGYMAGGQYDLYTIGDYDVLFFGEAGKVEHVRLYPKKPISLQTVRELLGQADFDQLDELLSGAWVLMYDFGRFTFFVQGDAGDSSSQVQYFFLKQEA